MPTPLPSSQPPDLSRVIQAALTVGARVLSLLDQREFASVPDLLHRRAQLIDHLVGLYGDQLQDEKHREALASVQLQHSALAQVLEEHESSLQQQLMDLQQTRTAQRRYDPPTPRRVLNEHVRG